MKKQIIIEELVDDFIRIEFLNNQKKIGDEISEAKEIFRRFSKFISRHDFKKMKGYDREWYEDMHNWNERQSSVLRSIEVIGFEKVISSDETEAEWIVYEAWLLGDLIKKYYKK